MMTASNHKTMVPLIIIVAKLITRKNRTVITVQVQIMKTVYCSNVPIFLDLLYDYCNSYSTMLVMVRHIYDSLCYNNELLIHCLVIHRLQLKTLYCP